jgi:hypothetical protein
LATASFKGGFAIIDILLNFRRHAVLRTILIVWRNARVAESTAANAALDNIKLVDLFFQLQALAQQGQVFCAKRCA